MLVKDETVGFQSIPDEEQMRDIWFPSERVSGDNKMLSCERTFPYPYYRERPVNFNQKLLSRSINEYLKQNFFELINEMRVGKPSEGCSCRRMLVIRR